MCLRDAEADGQLGAAAVVGAGGSPALRSAEARRHCEFVCLNRLSVHEVQQEIPVKNTIMEKSTTHSLLIKIKNRPRSMVNKIFDET